MAAARRYLLTGASGFLGSRLAQALIRRGADVHAIHRPGSDLSILGSAQERIHAWEYNGDSLLFDRLFATAKIDIVVHIAAMARYDCASNEIAPMIAANVTLGTQLLEAMARHGCCRLINTGTFWQHANGAAPSPICLYAAMKEAFEALVDYYAQGHKLSAITLKLFDVYGPADPRRKLFTQLNEAAAAGTPLPMTAGEQRLNLVHVQDVVAAYMVAADRLMSTTQSGSHERFFVPGKAIALRELVEMYAEIGDLTLDILWGKLPYRDKQIMEPYCGPVLPGWQAKIGLREGLATLVTADD